MHKFDPGKLAITIGGSLAAGATGSIFTAESIPNWYRNLEKPAFTPPDWLFGPVWTLLYILMGTAAYLVWTTKGHRIDRRRGLSFFGLQLVLNTLWSVVFFGAQSPSAGLAVILLLILAVLLTMRDFFLVRVSAGFLLVPYLLWICFATALNAGIVFLNR